MNSLTQIKTHDQQNQHGFGCGAWMQKQKSWFHFVDPFDSGVCFPEPEMNRQLTFHSLHFRF